MSVRPEAVLSFATVDLSLQAGDGVPGFQDDAKPKSWLLE
jgi:hypothetical protein